MTNWTTGKTQQDCFLKGKTDIRKFIWAWQANSKRNSKPIICLQKTIWKAPFFIHVMPLKRNKVKKARGPQYYPTARLLRLISGETFCKGRSPPGSAAEDAALSCREKLFRRIIRQQKQLWKALGVWVPHPHRSQSIKGKWLPWYENSLPLHIREWQIETSIHISRPGGLQESNYSLQ